MLHGVLRLKIKIKGCYSATIEGMGMLGEGGGGVNKYFNHMTQRKKRKVNG
jgi:hypothetical protein